MTLLAILCAVLVAVIACGSLLWWVTAKADEEHNEMILGVYRKAIDEARTEREDARERATKLSQGLEASATLISTAYALLHDERHKGKMGNQAAWIAARDEWSAKVKGAKA